MPEEIYRNASKKPIRGFVKERTKRNQKYYVCTATYEDPTTGKRTWIEAWRTKKSEASRLLTLAVEEASRRRAGHPSNPDWQNGAAWVSSPAPGRSDGLPEPDEVLQSGRVVEMSEPSCGELFDEYIKKVCIPVRKENGKRIEGMASYRATISLINRSLRPKLAKVPLRAVTTKFLFELKDQFLKEPSTVTRWNVMGRDREAQFDGVPFAAKRGGTCRECGKLFEVGELITKHGSTSPRVHAICYKPREIVTKERGIADVNRKLSRLRSIFKFAEDNGWIERTPFGKKHEGRSLIQVSAETERDTVASYEDEDRILSILHDPKTFERYRDLRLAFLIAMDCGMREGQIMKVRETDVEFYDPEDWVYDDDNDPVTCGQITFVSETSKTDTKITSAMTPRLYNALAEQLIFNRNRAEEGYRDGKEDRRLFNVKAFPNKYWTEVREIADVRGLRFHDIRHTVGTRLSMSGMAIQMVARLLGHKQLTTAYRYQNATPDLREAAAANLLQGRKTHEVKKKKKAARLRLQKTDA